MPDEDREQSYELLRRIGEKAGIDVALPGPTVPTSPGSAEAGRTLVEAGRGIAQDVGDVLSVPTEFPPGTSFSGLPQIKGSDAEQRRWQRMLTAGSPEAGALARTGIKNLLPKVIEFARKNPKTVAALLSALGTSTGARAAGEIPPDPDERKTAIDARLNAINAELSRLGKTSESTTRRGTVTTTGGNRSVIESLAGEKEALNKELAAINESNRSFNQRNPWFLPAAGAVAAGTGFAGGAQEAGQIARLTGKIPTTREQLGLATKYGLMTGSEGLASFAIPELFDLYGGSKKLSKETAAEPWQNLLTRLGLEVAGTTGVGIPASKVGSIWGARARNRNRFQPPVPTTTPEPSPATAIVNQIVPKTDPLAAMKKGPVPVGPTPHERVPRGHESGLGGKILPPGTTSENLEQRVKEMQDRIAERLAKAKAKAAAEKPEFGDEEVQKVLDAMNKKIKGGS